MRPTLIAELMELLEYAARTPSRPAGDETPANAMWKPRMCGAYRGCRHNQSSGKSESPAKSMRIKRSRLDLITSVSWHRVSQSIEDLLISGRVHCSKTATSSSMSRSRSGSSLVLADSKTRWRASMIKFRLASNTDAMVNRCSALRTLGLPARLLHCLAQKVYDLQKRLVEKRRKLPKERLGREERLVEHDAVQIIDQRYERGDFFLVVVA